MTDIELAKHMTIRVVPLEDLAAEIRAISPVFGLHCTEARLAAEWQIYVDSSDLNYAFEGLAALCTALLEAEASQEPMWILW